jgi:hypothetical protein
LPALSALGESRFPPGSTNIRNGAGHVGLATNINTTAALIYGTTTTGTAPYISLLSTSATGTTEVDIPAQSLRGKTVDILVGVRLTHYKQ